MLFLVNFNIWDWHLLQKVEKKTFIHLEKRLLALKKKLLLNESWSHIPNIAENQNIQRICNIIKNFTIFIGLVVYTHK